MQLYYATGGGLGHLARASAFFYTQKHLNPQKTILLTASQYTQIGFLPNFYKCIQIPPFFQTDLASYISFLTNCLKENNIDRVYLDAFPVGILGEWSDLFTDFSLDFYYIARMLHWENYLPLLASKPIRFEKTFLIENILPMHQEFILQNSKSVEQITLQYPPQTLTKDVQNKINHTKKQGKNIWLIIHSEPKDEVITLLEYAQATARLRQQSPFFYLVSQVKLENLPSSVLQIDALPCEELFEQAELIFSACGFNLMQQLLPFRQKHLFLPFERKYDLQFERAKHRK